MLRKYGIIITLSTFPSSTDSAALTHARSVSECVSVKKKGMRNNNKKTREINQNVNKLPKKTKKKEATEKDRDGEGLEASCCVCQLLFERWLGSAKWL